MNLSELKRVKAKDGRSVLVIGPHCWGRGATGAEAYSKARENLSYRARSPKFLFLDAPEKAYVDEMGSVCWKSGEDRPVEIGRFESKGGGL